MTGYTGPDLNWGSHPDLVSGWSVGVLWPREGGAFGQCLWLSGLLVFKCPYFCERVVVVLEKFAKPGVGWGG